MLTGLWSPVILVRAMRERAGKCPDVIKQADGLPAVWLSREN